jgi:hypothetical protein
MSPRLAYPAVTNTFSRRAALTSLTLLGAVAHAGAWDYQTKDDKMTGKVTKFASVTSDNKLDLRFPYQSEKNYGDLYVRQKAGRTDVYVTIEKGQILCPGYGDGCTVTVRFDNYTPARFSAIGPSDHGSTSFLIRDSARFVAAAKKARKILVQFTMFQSGQQVLEFSPGTPLEWAAPTKMK